jgi:DNA-binding NtrC family response regulator
MAGRSFARLDDATKKRLESEDWPGNVRELRNVLERAMILADGSVIRPEHLWIDSDTKPDEPAAAVSEGSLAELERRTIERTPAAVGGNRRLAAAKLGIGLRTLYEKLKRYDLHWKRGNGRDVVRGTLAFDSWVKREGKAPF